MSTQTITPRTARPVLGPCVPCLDLKKVEVPGVRLVGGESWCLDCFRGDKEDEEPKKVRIHRTHRRNKTSPAITAIRKLIEGRPSVIITTYNPKGDAASVHNEAKKFGIQIRTSGKGPYRLMVAKVKQ